MSRKVEDFDEFCNPDSPRIIPYDDVLKAAANINTTIIKSPCMPSHYQPQFTMQLYYMMEMLQASGSFKDRGALNVLAKLPLDEKKRGVVVASLGNEAISICYHAVRQGVPAIVVTPITVPISKQQRCHSMGAKVIVQGANLMEAQKFARALAREKQLTYINGRDHPDMLAGYGTLGLDILKQLPSVDAVIVPVGTGGLAAAVASVIKHDKPSCLVYGVQTEASPVFFNSLNIGQPQLTAIGSTMADSIAVCQVGVNSFATAQPLLDKMLLVKEDWIGRAMLHLMEKERLVVEPAGACSLATIFGSIVPELKLKTVVCILSGGNNDNIQYSRCLERGMAAEGRLVKFRVWLKDSAADQSQLLQLIAAAGYNVIDQFQHHRWMYDDLFWLELVLTCHSKNLAHALELKQIMERAYPGTVTFDTEPFNDKRTCPCYVWKPMKPVLA